MKISETELNVLKVMAEKEIDWSWIILDRTLAVRKIPGFGNVARIVTNLVDNGLVDVVKCETTSRSRYRVSKNGFIFINEQQSPEQHLP